MESQPVVLEMAGNCDGTTKSNDAFVKDITTEGKQSDTFTDEGTSELVELPPLTYIDFIPECKESQTAGKEPSYADFGSVVDQANRWLLSALKFEVYKCETLSVKLSADYKPQTGQALLHVASNGKNSYLRILRLWLIPRTDSNSPAQQLGYITVLPDHASGSRTQVLNLFPGTTTTRNVVEVNLSSFDNVRTTVDRLNSQLQLKPLPGRVLTVETQTFKCLESGTCDKLNPEASLWSEAATTARLYLTGLRIFYVTGLPACEAIGFYDEVPEMFHSKDGLGLKVKFATVDQTLSKASHWLQRQQDVRVVSIQMIDVKLERTQVSNCTKVQCDPLQSGYTETPGLTEMRYTKILRIAYIKGKTLDNSPLYSGINLTSRLFIPARIKRRNFETFSQTMHQVASWLRTSGTPLLMCETTRYYCSRPDFVINGFQSYLMCI
ncbi:unnamed protein product [Candidula unifasciata]|uniref:Uncharacterized protein n=1 Tax=Candidula unifasciata TaxID=100452 RepID=A0A8S3ZGX5_9EUPU|nr:unnamed protein product [Candidula unifasciata]